MSGEEWVWRGMAGHLIVASKCCFHLSTDIGGHRISTIGCYHPQGNGEGPRKTVGCDRLYETMVFAIGADDEIVPNELDAAAYNDEKAAEVGHLAMCRRWSASPPVVERGES